MKSTSVFLLFFMVYFGSKVSGQTPTSADSITTFYHSFLDSLEARYLNKKLVHWKTLKIEVLKEALKAKDFEQSLAVASSVFDTILCNHCILFSDQNYYGSSLNKPLAEEDFSSAFLEKLEEEPSFEVKLLHHNIGYINIPGMLMIDLSQDSLNAEAQKMYDQIVTLWNNEVITGWIIDLRFNVGGNVYPMLEALYSLLGDKVVYHALNQEEEYDLKHYLKNGGFYSGEKLEVEVLVSRKPEPDLPVALITGKMTGSSGEVIVVAFKHRKNTIVIGERSYGLLTANDLLELPYHTKLAVTTSYITDTTHQYVEYITPDIEVIKQDNFENYEKDENIRQAVEFINTSNQ